MKGEPGNIDEFFVISTEGCEKQLHCVLMKVERDGKMITLSHRSLKVTFTKQDCDTTHIEYMSFLAALLLWTYLQGVVLSAMMGYEEQSWM